MKNVFLFIILSGLLCSSCFQRTTELPHVENCPDVNIQASPILIHGFEFKDVDTVIIKTFKKKSNFKTLVETIYCYQEKQGQYSSPISIKSPKPLWTSFDWQIIVADSLIFYIDSTIVKSEPHATMTSLDFECEITEYRLNGKMEKSKNITIWKPGTISLNRK